MHQRVATVSLLIDSKVVSCQPWLFFQHVMCVTV